MADSWKVLRTDLHYRLASPLNYIRHVIRLSLTKDNSYWVECVVICASMTVKSGLKLTS